MKNINFRKYKLIIILIILLIPSIIFRKNIILFVTNVVGQREGVLGVIKKNKKIQTKEINSDNNVIKINPETPGALKLIDKFINVSETDLNKDRVIIETNMVRVKNKLPDLKENKLLNLSAEKKLNDIFAKQYFEHVSPDGIGIENLSQDVGYEYILIGENLAMGSFKNEKILVDAWMGSFGHRKNILKQSYTEIGVAVARGIFNGETVWVAVQHFGTPKSVCPRIDGSLHTVALFNQEQIKKLEEDLRMRLVRINTSRGYYSTVSKDEEIKRVEEYNNLVNYYNSLVDQVEKDVNTYNNQVKSFNECVLKHQE